MKPQIKLAETTTPDGKRLTLQMHDGDFSLRVEGRELMHSSVAASELHLGELAAERIGGAGVARVLIGGLGMGFTLRSVLGAAGPNVTVVVAELIPEVLDWNRTHMGELNGVLLNDPRVTVLIENVNSVLGRAQAGEYDAILLDIDNGPSAMVQAGNARLYDRRGIERIMHALKPGGRAAIWSAGIDEKFAERLRLAAGKSRPCRPNSTPMPGAAPTRSMWPTRSRRSLAGSARSRPANTAITIVGTKAPCQWRAGAFTGRFPWHMTG